MDEEGGCSPCPWRFPRPDCINPRAGVQAWPALSRRLADRRPAIPFIPVILWACYFYPAVDLLDGEVISVVNKSSILTSWLKHHLNTSAHKRLTSKWNFKIREMQKPRKKISMQLKISLMKRALNFHWRQWAKESRTVIWIGVNRGRLLPTSWPLVSSHKNNISTTVFQLPPHGACKEKGEAALRSCHLRIPHYWQVLCNGVLGQDNCWR